MRRPFRPSTARLALAAVAAATILTGPRVLRAHEIPARVTVLAFVKPDSGRLRIVLRAPLEAMRDVHFPLRGTTEYLDVGRAAPMAREGARLWLADYITAYENGRPLPDARIVATRVSVPSERTFDRYESALAHIMGAPLDTATLIPWTQALLDVVLEYPLQETDGSIAIDTRLAGLGIRTTTVLRYLPAGGAERVYRYTGDPGLVRLDPRWHQAAVSFVALGIEHILGGIDHLLFVLCLVIPFRRIRPLVLIVTAFTVAHSITLCAAALGVVPDALWFPPLVETLIAASIVYMALENIVGPKLRPRWALAFGFGLVHGFGFSFALSESLQFAGPHLATSLLAFNLGVEIGQLAVLMVAVPVLSLAFARVRERIGVIVLSALIAHTAWHWMLEQGAALTEYEIGLPALNLAFAASAMRFAMVALTAGAAAWGLARVARWAANWEPDGPGAPQPVAADDADSADDTEDADTANHGTAVSAPSLPSARSAYPSVKR